MRSTAGTAGTPSSRPPSPPPWRPIEADMARTASAIADLEVELGAIAESTAAGPDDEHDAEGSTVGYERARVSSLLDLARRHLADLEAAGERSRNGIVVRCEACGTSVPAERLAALPATRRCVGCAGRPERR